MTQTIVDFFSQITHNDYLTLFIISIIPIIELRGALVIMAGMQNVNEIAGMFCCIAGSTTVVVPLLLLIRPLIRQMKKSKWFAKIGKRIESSLSERAENAYSEKKQLEIQAEEAGESAKKPKKPLSIDTKKFLGLFVFVAIPLPMTGAWTGSCVGSILDFPVWKAAFAVFFGNIAAAIILTLIAWLMPQQYVDIFLYGFVVLAIALAISFYFTHTKKAERKRAEGIAKYGNKNEYELAILKQEADKSGEVLIKKEYIDENGDKHIVIGHDESKNKNIVGNDDVI